MCWKLLLYDQDTFVYSAQPGPNPATHSSLGCPRTASKSCVPPCAGQPPPCHGRLFEREECHGLRGSCAAHDGPDQVIAFAAIVTLSQSAATIALIPKQIWNLEQLGGTILSWAPSSFCRSQRSSLMRTNRESKTLRSAADQEQPHTHTHTRRHRRIRDSVQPQVLQQLRHWQACPALTTNHASKHNHTAKHTFDMHTSL